MFLLCIICMICMILLMLPLGTHTFCIYIGQVDWVVITKVSIQYVSIWP